MATENVRWDIELVRKQREKVQWLERRGQDTVQAKKVLDAAEDLLLLHMADRERLLAEAEIIDAPKQIQRVDDLSKLDVDRARRDAVVGETLRGHVQARLPARFRR